MSKHCMISWWCRWPSVFPSTLSSGISPHVETTALLASSLEIGTSACTMLPMVLSFLLRSFSTSTSYFSVSSIFSLTSLACAFSSSHLSVPFESFIFCATVFEIIPSSLRRLSTSNLTIKCKDILPYTFSIFHLSQWFHQLSYRLWSVHVQISLLFLDHHL